MKLFAVACDAGMAADALVGYGLNSSAADRTDRWHTLCDDAFRKLRVPLLTSEAVLTELFHLMGHDRHQMEVAWNFVRSGAVVLGVIEDFELPQLQVLMSRYWDRPMDFADATLVYLAKRESLSLILTVDHDDFATYRIDGKRQFRILPPHRP